MNDHFFKNEAITSFLDEDGVKFYLTYKWNEKMEENFLKLTLTDLTTFWTETCKKTHNLRIY